MSHTMQSFSSAFISKKTVSSIYHTPFITNLHSTPRLQGSQGAEGSPRLHVYTYMSMNIMTINQLLTNKYLAFLATPFILVYSILRGRIKGEKCVNSATVFLRSDAALE